MTDVTHVIALSDVGHDLVSRDPLKLAVAGYLARYKAGTLKDFTHDLKVYLDWCERRDLHPLHAQRGHVELYVRWLEQAGWASSTVSRRVTVVCGFYKYALRDDIIQKDPCVWIERPKVDRASQRRTYLTALDFGKWMAAAQEMGPTYFALGSLIGLRGLRISEALMLNVEGVRKVGGYETISFIRKGGKNVTLALPVPVGMAVRDCIGERDMGPLLVNNCGRRMDRATATRRIRVVCDEAKINRNVSPHSFRRTFITTALAMGIPLRDVQVAAGHASSSTTEIYDMGTGNPDRDAAHRLASYVMGIAG